MPEPIRIRMDMTTAQAVEFVDKLENDSEFRTRLQQTPGEVLWEYGIEASPGLIPATLTLPSPTQIASLNAQVQSLLENEEAGVVVGPALLFPIWTCVFSFPFLSGEAS